MKYICCIWSCQSTAHSLRPVSCPSSLPLPFLLWIPRNRISGSAALWLLGRCGQWGLQPNTRAGEGEKSPFPPFSFRRGLRKWLVSPLGSFLPGNLVSWALVIVAFCSAPQTFRVVRASQRRSSGSPDCPLGPSAVSFYQISILKTWDGPYVPCWSLSSNENR